MTPNTNGKVYTIICLLKYRAWLITLCIAAVFPLEAIAQYYNLTFRNYMSHTGIAQSEVDAIFEDSRGFLWVGTHFGLTRYDGREFRSFYHHADDPGGIGDNEISDIDEDSKGMLWMALYNTGFCSYDTRTSKFYNYTKKGPDALPSRKVESLLVDGKDRIWLGTDSGLSVFDPDKNTYRNIRSLGNDDAPIEIIALVMDSADRIWICTRNAGLWIMPEDMQQAVRAFSYAQVGEVRDVHIRRDGSAWVASSRGLFELNPGSKGVSRAIFFPQSESLRDVDVDVNGNIWMATDVNGLFIYFPSSGFIDHLRENFSSARGLLSNRMFELYKDSRQGIWLGGENGLQYFHYSSQKFNIYPGLSNVSDQLRGSTLYGIEEVDNDLIMASSGGMLVYNRVSNKYIPIQYPGWYTQGSIRFRSLRREGASNWWVCSDQGIFKIIQKNGNYILSRPEQLKQFSIFREKSFRKYLKNGRDYWFALAEEGLLHWNQVSGKISKFGHIPGDSNSLPSNIINQMEFDREGNLMLGHNEGMSVFNTHKKTFTHYRERADNASSGLNNRYVYDMHDDGVYYWMATFGGGLNRVLKKTGRVDYFTTREGLSNDGIYSMVAENDSILWLGTAKGLNRFHTVRQKFQNFHLDDGLPSEEFNMLSRYANSDGEIFMGTMNGLISFDGSNIRKTNISPRIYLSKIRLNGDYLSDSIVSDVNTKRILDTKFREGVYLEFSSMVFNGSNDLQLRYRVNEVDTGWRSGENGSLVPLINTEPGIYTLVAQVYRTQGQEASPEWTMRFQVKPPYWRTIPFRLMITALSLLALFFMFRAYIRRKLRSQRVAFEQEKAVERERSRISAELHDDIGGGLTAIRLMSEMVKDKSEDDRNKVYISKISASANELVQKMNEIVWAMNLNNDNLQSLVSYTREFAVSYLDDFNIGAIVKIPDNISNLPVSGTNRRDIFLLVKETLNNIVKHAQATQVHLEFTIDSHLRIKIRDNGKGFDEAAVRKGANGLVNMQKRVRKLGGRMEIRQDGGTVLIFDIPLSSLHQAVT